MFQSVSLITSLLSTLGASHALEQGAYCPPPEVHQNHQTLGRKVVGNRTTRGSPDDHYGASTSKTDCRVLRRQVPVLRELVDNGRTSVSPVLVRYTIAPRCSRGACDAPRAIGRLGESIPYAPRCGPGVSARERTIERTNRVEVFSEGVGDTICGKKLGLDVRVKRNLAFKHQIRARVHRIRKIERRGSRRLRDL
jgi:hypothetical protein